jgi:signal transduction histidine kinase
VALAVIVDDHSTNRNILRRLAATIEDDMKVLAFASPIAAIGSMKVKLPDLVITDFNMPGMNGAEFIKRCRMELSDPDLPIMVVTAYEDREYRYKALDAGATDFLTTPVDYREFRLRCANVLRMSRQQRLLQQHADLLQENLEELKETLRKQAERDAQDQKMAALGQLTGGMAHNFNNLIGAIMGFAEFLVHDLEDKPQKRFAERILTAGGRAKALVQGILAFSRRGLNGPVVVTLSEIVEEAASLLVATLPITAQVIVGKLDRRKSVLADRGQLVQMMLNLCINSSDALGGNPGVIRIDIEPFAGWGYRAARASGHGAASGLAIVAAGEDGAVCIAAGDVGLSSGVVIRVVDSGCGIPLEIAPRVFEPFFTTKDVGVGTGLGLAAVLNLVMAHGGGIRITSAIGRGTTVEVALPLATSAPGADDLAEAVSVGCDAVPTIAPHQARILIVDDEPEFCEMMDIAVKRLGYQAVSSNSPVKALELFEAGPLEWDLVISDQMMPQMTGVELIRRMKETRPDVKCVLCSGDAAGFYEKNKLVAGASGFLTKPVDMFVLAKMLNALLIETRSRTD